MEHEENNFHMQPDDYAVVPSAPNTATAPPVDGSFEYGYHG